MFDPSPILDLHRDARLAHGEDEIDFGFGLPFGEMGHVQADQRAEEVAYDALGNVPCHIVEMGRRGEALRVERDHLLQPGRPEHRVAEADFRGTPTSLETQLEGLDQADQERTVQELEVGQGTLGQPMFAFIASRISSMYIACY